MTPLYLGASGYSMAFPQDSMKVTDGASNRCKTRLLQQSLQAGAALGWWRSPLTRSATDQDPLILRY
jgi:hypothetical protein